MTDTHTQPEITPETLAEWRKVAEAATRQRWQTLPDEQYWTGDVRVGWFNEEDFHEVCSFVTDENDEANAAHIAVACPTNFLALLDHIAALEARCKAAEEERDSHRNELDALSDENDLSDLVANYFALGLEFGVNLNECESVYEGVTEWKKQAEARADTLAAENEALRAALKPRPRNQWHEDVGPVLWWARPLNEPPYVGTPLDAHWPGYHRWWTPLPAAPREIVEADLRRAAQALGDRT